MENHEHNWVPTITSEDINIEVCEECLAVRNADTKEIISEENN